MLTSKLALLVLAFIGALALIFGLGLLLAWPLALIINYVFTPSALLAVFGGQLTFWKAYWLSVATSWLFKASTSSSTSK